MIKTKIWNCKLAPLSRRSYLLILASLLFYSATAQTRLPGSVRLRGQADVDSFAAVFAGQTLEIGGRLQLGGSADGPGKDIIDLRPLAMIRQVGAFEVIQCDVLETLNGLDSLRVQGYVIISANPRLRDIGAIRSSRPSDLLLISDNAALEAVYFDLTRNLSGIGISECPAVDTIHVGGPGVVVFDEVSMRNVGVRHLGRGDLPVNRPMYLRLLDLPELRSIDFSDGVEGVPYITFEDLPKLALVRSSKTFGSFVQFNGTDNEHVGAFISFHNRRALNDSLTILDSFFLGPPVDKLSLLEFVGFSGVRQVNYYPSYTSGFEGKDAYLTLVNFTTLQKVSLDQFDQLRLTLVAHPNLNLIEGLDQTSKNLFLNVTKVRNIKALGPWHPGLETAFLSIVRNDSLETITDFPTVKHGWSDRVIGNLRLRQMAQFHNDAFASPNYASFNWKTNLQLQILDNPILKDTYQGFDVDTTLILKLGIGDRLLSSADTTYVLPNNIMRLRGFQQLNAVLGTQLAFIEPFYLGLHGDVDLEPFERLTTFSTFAPGLSGQPIFTGNGPIISFSRDSRLVAGTAELFPALRGTPYLTFRGGEPINGNVLRTNHNALTYRALGQPIHFDFPSLDTIHIEHRAQGLLGDSLYFPYTRPLKSGIAWDYATRRLAPSQPTFYFFDNPEATRFGTHFDTTVFRDTRAQIFLIQNPQLDDCSALCALVESGTVASDDAQVYDSNGPNCQSLAEVLARCRAVGVSETEAAARTAGFTIYPNPAHQRVELSTTDVALDPLGYDLFNLQGQLLRALPIPAGVKRFGLDVSDLAPGTYLCRPRSGGTGRLLVIQ